MVCCTRLIAGTRGGKFFFVLSCFFDLFDEHFDRMAPPLFLFPFSLFPLFSRWEGTVALRKIGIAMIGVFGAEMESMQVHLTLMLVVCIMVVTSQVRPFGGLKGGMLHTLEMASLMATFLTLWAGSVFSNFPECEDPTKGEGETVPWCDALSIVVGSLDIAVVMAFVACFVYLKVSAKPAEKVKDDEDDVEHFGLNDDTTRVDTEVDPVHIEMTLTVAVNDGVETRDDPNRTYTIEI
jgi:hypothetical protein